MADLKDNYDAVVIGAGMAGLTCGALLAHEGMAVLVADRLPRPGGYCTSLPGDGFSFDPAVAILEGCDRGGIVAQTLADLKVEDELELLPLDPLSEIIGPGYKLTVRRRLAGFGEDLKSLAPAESENVDRFLNECQAVYKQMALMAAAAWEMRRARTTVIPRRQPSALVTTGIFAFSRNPIYLGDLSVAAGAMLWLQVPWGLPLVGLLARVLRLRFIEAEEQRLMTGFGAEYGLWAARTARWLGRKAG